MIRTPFFALICALLLCACSDETPAPRIEASADRVVLQGAAGSSVALTVTSDGPWEAFCTGEGFAADPLAGGKGETTITLTASAANDGRSRSTLGSLTLRLPNAGTESSVEVLQSPATAPQTMLLYMPGRSLWSAYKENVAGICRAVSAQVPGDARIVVCYQPATRSEATLAEIRYDFGSRGSVVEELKTYPSFSAGSQQDLARMFNDVAEFAPAQSYGLVIGCHGKAWVPLREGVLTDRESFGADRLPVDRPDDLWHPLPGAKQTRSFGDSGHEIDIPAFAAVIDALPYRFDYLIFDACFMASVETLYDLRRGFDYVIASPCEIMAAGFPYERAVPWLTDSGAALRERLAKVCYEFWNFYENDWDAIPGNEQSGAISLCVTAELDALADVAARLYAGPQRSYDRNSLQAYEGLRTHVFYDLGHYVRTACTDAALLDEFRERMDAAFPADARLHTARFYSAYNGMLNALPAENYSGVSTGEPSSRYRDSFVATDWYRATH